MNEKTSEPQPHRDTEQRVLQVQKSEMFSGPVPHPDIIERYEQIHPGAAKTIFDEWEAQVKHRHALEKAVVKTDNVKSLLGVVFGFIVVLVAIGAGVYTALRGYTLFGGGLSFAGLVMLGAAFVTSRKK